MGKANSYLGFLLIAGLLGLATAHATFPPSKNVSPETRRLLAQASEKLSSKDFVGAKVILSQIVARDPSSAEAHNLLGVCLERLGEITKARESFRKVTSLNPHFASPHLNLASVLLTLKDEAGAVRSIKRAIALEPEILANHPKAFLLYYLLGLDHARQGKTEEAIKSLQFALQRNPNFVPAQVDLGKLFLHHKQEDAALQQFLSVLSVRPRETLALRNTGLIYARKGKFEAAAGYLSRAYKLAPEDTSLALALIGVQLQLGKKDEAEMLTSHLRNSGQFSVEQIQSMAVLWLNAGYPNQGARLVQDHPEAAVRFQESAFRQAKEGYVRGKYAEAAEILEAIKGLRPTDVVFHDLLGSLYYALGDPKKASDEFQEAVRLDPQNEQLYFKLGMVFLKYQTPEPAIYVFEHALKTRPDAALLWLGLGLSQNFADQVEKAEKSLRRAIALDPTFTDAYVVLGDLLLDWVGKLPDTLAIFKKAIETNPNLYISYYYYGKAALRMNEADIENTIEILRKSTQLNPGFADGYYELGRAFEEAGRLKEAIAEFNKSLEKNPQLSKSHYRLSRIYRTQGDTARADREFQAFQETQETGKREKLIKHLEYRIEKP